MISSWLGHIQFQAAAANLGFYKDLLSFLGWTVWVEDPSYVGMGGQHGASLWFTAPPKDVVNDYDGPGMNHLGIAVEHQADVDAVATYLQEHGIAALFDTPRHRPDFSSDPQTYYQVMFESPDRILFEVVYTGPKE